MWRYTYFESDFLVDAEERNYIMCYPVKSEWTTESREEFEAKLGRKVHSVEFKLVVVSGAV